MNVYVCVLMEGAGVVAGCCDGIPWILGRQLTNTTDTESNLNWQQKEKVAFSVGSETKLQEADF